jgi:hypothetical protein
MILFQQISEAVNKIIHWPTYLTEWLVKKIHQKTNHIKEVNIEIKEEIVPVKVSKHKIEKSTFNDLKTEKKTVVPEITIENYSGLQSSTPMYKQRYLKFNRLHGLAGPKGIVGSNGIPGPSVGPNLFKIGDSQLDGCPIYRSYMSDDEIRNLQRYYEIEELFNEGLYK